MEAIILVWKYEFCMGFYGFLWISLDTCIDFYGFV